MEGEIVTGEEFEAGLKNSLETFEDFRRRLFSVGRDELRYADYGWRRADTAPRSLDMVCKAFGDMSEEFARDAANQFNKLINLVVRLKVWSEILDKTVDKNARWEIFHEFVSSQAHLSMTLPFTMREKFFFYYAHLCNQDRRIHGGISRDDLRSDDKINRRVAYEYADDWDRGRMFLDAIDRIAGPDMASKTMNFRNGFTHQVTPGIEWGITKITSRHVVNGQDIRETQPNAPDFDSLMIESGMVGCGKEKSVIYGFGGQPPLKITVIIEVLTEQIQIIHSCFEIFKEFVWHLEDQLPDPVRGM